MFNLSDIPILNQFFNHKSENSEKGPERLRHEFVKRLLQNNYVVVYCQNGETYRVEALSYDRRRNQIIISDKAEQGLLYLDKGDQLEVYTSLNNKHEYFCFSSRVNKVRVKGVRFFYYLDVPKLLKKSKRRINRRFEVNNHSIFRINGTAHSGRVLDISKDGIGIAIAGYYPLPIEVGYNLGQCKVDIFLPRINDNISFDCSINIRRISYVSKPEAMTIISGLFDRTTVEQESAINQYIQKKTLIH